MTRNRLSLFLAIPKTKRSLLVGWSWFAFHFLALKFQTNQGLPGWLLWPFAPKRNSRRVLDRSVSKVGACSWSSCCSGRRPSWRPSRRWPNAWRRLCRQQTRRARWVGTGAWTKVFGFLARNEGHGSLPFAFRMCFHYYDFPWLVLKGIIYITTGHMLFPEGLSKWRNCKPTNLGESSEARVSLVEFVHPGLRLPHFWRDFQLVRRCLICWVPSNGVAHSNIVASLLLFLSFSSSINFGGPRFQLALPRAQLSCQSTALRMERNPVGQKKW